MTQARKLPDTVAHEINSYLGNSGKEYDFDEYIYLSYNWHDHFTIRKNLLERVGQSGFDELVEETMKLNGTRTLFHF